MSTSSKPIRYLVRCHHAPAEPGGRVEEVIVTYHSDLDNGGVDAFDCAVHTAQRYAGTIYADFGVTSKGEPDIEFARSYSRRPWWKDAPALSDTELVALAPAT